MLILIITSGNCIVFNLLNYGLLIRIDIINNLVYIIIPSLLSQLVILYIFSFLI